MGLSCLGHYYLHPLSVLSNDIANELLSYPCLVLQTFHQVIPVDRTTVVLCLAPDAYLESNAGLWAPVGEAKVVKAVSLRGEGSGKSCAIKLSTHEGHLALFELEKELSFGFQVDSNESMPS